MFLPTDSLPSHKSTSGSLGWGGVGWDKNFIGISTWSWCYALWSSLAFPYEFDATLYDLQLQFHTSASDSLGWGGVGWDNNVIGISTWSWCYALWSSLAFPHDLDATLYDLQLQFHASASDSLGWGGVWWDNNVIGISTWSWCYALWSSLAFPHDLDATLYDLHWHFHMNLMLRSMIFNCNSTWSWCYALWSSIAIPHDLDSWCYVLWSSIGISTWSWCYALWSSLAFPHDLDATLYDLHWHFHMNLMLLSMIFNCNSTNLMLRSVIFNVRKSCGCPFWGWSDGRVVTPK